MRVKWGGESSAYIHFLLRPGHAECLKMSPFFTRWQQAVPTPFSTKYFLSLSTVASNTVARLYNIRLVNTATISLHTRSTRTNSGVSSWPSSTSTSQPYKHIGRL